MPVKGLESWDAFLVEMSQHDRQKPARAISEIYGTYLNPADFTAARAASFGLYRQGRIGEMMASNQIYLRDFYGKKKAAEGSVMNDDERRKLVSTEQSLGMAPASRAADGLEGFTPENRPDEEKSPQDFSNADSFFNLPDADEDDDEDDHK